MFSLEKKLFRLVVDGIRAQDGQLVNAELAAMQHFLSPVYLGSAPEVFHKELKVIYAKKRSKIEKDILKMNILFALKFSQRVFQSKACQDAFAISK